MNQLMQISILGFCLCRIKLVSIHCKIIDKYRFRHQVNRARGRETQQTSMGLLWWTASSVWFSMSVCSLSDVATAPSTGVCGRQGGEWARKREHSGERKQKERMSNELRWVQHLHSLPAFFCSEEGRRGMKKKRRYVHVCVLWWWWGDEETSVRWRSFWRLKRSCTRAVEPSMGLKNTAKTWEGRRHGLTMALGPMLGSKGQPEMGREWKTEWKWWTCWDA